MLTEIERERLVNRDKGREAAITHRNDMIVRAKLQKWIDDIPDILFILEHLPARQLKKVFGDIEVFRLQYISEILMRLLDFKPIIGPLDMPEEWTVKTKKGERKATDNDIQRSILVSGHKRTLGNHSSTFDPATTAAEWLTVSSEERAYRTHASGAEPEKIKRALERVLKVMAPPREPPA